MKLSIIILTYNSVDKIKTCIDALLETVTIRPLEWIIVDNASNDGTIEIVKKLLPEAILIRNKTNKGVAAARNQALKISNGEYVLLLDDDTKVIPNAVNELCTYLDLNPECALAAPQLLNPDGTLQANALKVPSILNKSIRVIRKLLGKSTFNPYRKEIENQKAYQPGYLLGACQLIRRKVILEIGLLDEKIFYGPEDAEYCIRLKNKGYKIAALPFIYVIHNYRRLSYSFKKPWLIWNHFKGLIYFWWKHYPLL